MLKKNFNSCIIIIIKRDITDQIFFFDKILITYTQNKYLILFRNSKFVTQTLIEELLYFLNAL